MAEELSKIENIAKQILEVSRSMLMVNFRFLGRALSALDFSQAKDMALCNDGRFIYYDPKYILIRYRQEQTGLTRDLLHTVLHCVLRHAFVGKNIDRDRWNLACDIAVEAMLSDMASELIVSEREKLQQATVSLLQDELGTLTAEKIYKWLGDRQFLEDELDSLKDSFRGDSHGIWYGTGDKSARLSQELHLQEIWEDISKRMQTELETLNKDNASALTQSLRLLNKEKRDYSAFLRRFAVSGEVMKLSDEEFDQNFYTYGLELYENIPLIEPLEYSEQNRIREFVIAIDTSGSVKGEKVQAFIQKTYDILRAEDTFSSRVKIYIIQCDDRIQDVAVIETGEQLEAYLLQLEIRGLGQTDFRPVFAYVDELLRTRELRQLQGLLYFTDGDGIYPDYVPGYKTAFVLSDDESGYARVPVWAIATADDDAGRDFEGV